MWVLATHDTPAAIELEPDALHVEIICHELGLVVGSRSLSTGRPRERGTWATHLHQERPHATA
eukprot:3460825-Prorocentrum_lima.AAC.1